MDIHALQRKLDEAKYICSGDVAATLLVALRLGRPLLRAQLISLIYGVDGVANCRLAEPEADMALDSVTLPVLGELTIENGEEARP